MHDFFLAADAVSHRECGQLGFGFKFFPPLLSHTAYIAARRAYDYDPNKEAQAFQQAAPVAQKEEDAPKLPQHVSEVLKLPTLLCSDGLSRPGDLSTCLIGGISRRAQHRAL